MKPLSLSEAISLSEGRTGVSILPLRDEVISSDEILDLIILLHTTDSVDSFLKGLV